MKLVAGGDNAGIALREEIRGYLQRLVHERIDVSACNAEPFRGAIRRRPRNNMLETEVLFQPTRMR